MSRAKHDFIPAHELDALRAFIADIPDVRRYADMIVLEYPHVATALVQATRGQGLENRGYYLVQEGAAASCIPLGLVGARTRVISNFGLKVRKALMED